MANMRGQKKRLNICILARKRLYRNTRIVRQARALSEGGHQVTVVAIELPSEELRALTPKVRYVEVQLESFIIKAINKVNRIKNKVRKLRNNIRKVKFKINRVTQRPRNFIRRLIARTKRVVFGIEPPVYFSPREISQAIADDIQPAVKEGLDSSWIRSLLTPYVNAANTIDFARRCVKGLRDQHFDYCQAHDSFALYAAAKVSRECGGRIVYDAVEIPEDRSGIAMSRAPKWLKRYEIWRDSRIIRSAEKVLTIGPAVADFTAKRYGIKTPFVVRNCCLFTDVKPDNDIRKDLGLEDNEKIGVVIGSIYNNQGFEQLIESIPYLDANIHIVALGPESERGFADQLREMARDRGAAERFHILPPQPPHLLLNYAASADIGIIARQANCLNNLYSLPNKVFEMIMARLPVACSRLPNIQMIVDEYGIGESFDETDPRDIARVINSMLGSNDNLLSFQKAVGSAALELSWEQEGRKYLNFIES